MLYDFKNNRGLNLANPKYDKDAVNFRTLRKYAVEIVVSGQTLDIWTGSTGTSSAVIKSTNNSASGNYSAVLGGDNINATQDNTLYTQNLRAAQNGGIIYSAGTNLYNIFAPIGSDTNTFISNFQYDGSNKFTITRSDSNQFNAVINQVTGLTVSGNLSASTIYSGSTDLYDIFLTTADGNDITRIQPGTNINTGGTVNEPVINLNNNISVTSVSANTISGGTIYSGSTDVSDLFKEWTLQTDFESHTGDTNNPHQITASQVGTYTTAQTNNLLNTKADLSGATFTGTIDAPTILSGGTDLSDIFISSNNGVTGSGSINNIPLWNGTQNLTDSIMSQSGTSGVTVAGDVYIQGNVEVLGTATTINTQDLAVKDNSIILNSGGTHTSANNGGIIIKDGVSNGSDSSWLIDGDGKWHTNQGVKLFAQGSSSGDRVFSIRDSGDTSDLMLITGDGNLTLGEGGVSSPDALLNIRQQTNNALFDTINIRNSTDSVSHYRLDDLGNHFLNSTSIYNGRLNFLNGGTQIGQLQARSGNVMRYGGSSSVVHQFHSNTSNANWSFKIAPNINAVSFNDFGIGSRDNPTATLDVRAQGITSLDDELRVRNSGNTADLFLVRGDGTTEAQNFSTTTLSGGTIYSGSTDLYDIFAPTNSNTNSYVTGFTYNNSNEFTISVNDGNNYSTIINEVSGLTSNGDFNVYGQSIFSGNTDVVTIYGSGDTFPTFSVQGSSGELFTVTDSLSGSLFSVNDISGLPVLEVFDDDTVLMGNYSAPSLNTTAKVTVNSGQTTVYSIPASAYTGAFFDYTVTQTSGARSGNVMAIWSGTSNIEFSETSTADIGNSSDLTFDVAISGTDVLFRASANTNSWTVKTIVRSI